MKMNPLAVMAVVAGILISGCEKQPEAPEKIKTKGAAEKKETTEKARPAAPEKQQKQSHETAEWLTNFEKAKQLAAKENKLILADFAGSDWCGWCMRLDREVFSKPQFLEFAKKHFILLMLDFPRSKPQSAEVKKQNAELAGKYGIRGYPTVLILDSKGKVLEKTGYMRGGPKAYIKNLQEILNKVSK